MPTHRRTWQKREQAAASVIGARRQPGSGSSGRTDQTRSDSTHPSIFLECKAHAKHAAVTLWDGTEKLARKEGKVPLVCLSVKGRPGRWWLLHHKHLMALVVQWLSQQDAETLDGVQREVWKARGQ